MEKKQSSTALSRAGRTDLRSLLMSGLQPGLWTQPQLCKFWSGKGTLQTMCLPYMAFVSFKFPSYELHFAMLRVGIGYSKWNSLRTTAFLLIFRSQLKLDFNVKFAWGSADGSQTPQASICLLYIDVVITTYKTARELISYTNMPFPCLFCSSHFFYFYHLMLHHTPCYIQPCQSYML